MKPNIQKLRVLAVLGLMGGAMYAVAGCGGSVSNTVPVTQQTDTNVIAGQHLYVANQTNAGTAAVLRYDQILSQGGGANLSPNAQFTGFNTLGQINVDFNGDLLVPDKGTNLISVYDNAETLTGVVQTGANSAVSATSPNAVTYDSSHDFYYVATGSEIQQFTSAGTPGGSLSDSLMPQPSLLSVDDLHTLQASGQTGVLFAAGTNGASGVITIITEPQNLVGVGDISTNPNVAHITNLFGVNVVNPTGIAYDSTHEQLWIADPGAGYIFLLDNADNITASTVSGDQVLGAAFQIPATQLAVDFSTGVAALVTMNANASGDTLSVYPTTEQIGASEGLFISGEIPTPTTIVLNGVSAPQALVIDSLH